MNLVTQISQILEPLYATFGGQSGRDLESRLKNDLERFTRYMPSCYHLRELLSETSVAI